jgi:hypothetical protein
LYGSPRTWAREKAERERERQYEEEQQRAILENRTPPPLTFMQQVKIFLEKVQVERERKREAWRQRNLPRRLRAPPSFPAVSSSFVTPPRPHCPTWEVSAGTEREALSLDEPAGLTETALSESLEESASLSDLVSGMSALLISGPVSASVFSDEEKGAQADGACLEVQVGEACAPSVHLPTETARTARRGERLKESPDDSPRPRRRSPRLNKAPVNHHQMETRSKAKAKGVSGKASFYSFCLHLFFFVLTHN